MCVAVLMVGVLGVGTIGSAHSDRPSGNVPKKVFNDVPIDHWAYQEILTLHQRGIIAGHGDGTFKPNDLVSRAEFAKMMVLALGLELAKPASPSFADVPPSDWAYRYVETARYYLTGFRTSRGDYFRPQEAAVREDMAVALAKALGYASEADDVSELDDFADKDDVSTNLRGYVAAAVREGLMEGYPSSDSGGKRFRPMGSLTRAEAAALLYRLLDVEEGEKVTYDSSATGSEPGGEGGSGDDEPCSDDPCSEDSRPAPEVTAYVSGDRVVINWQPITVSGFQGYKVVISKYDENPAYPDDGYLYYITDKNRVSAYADNETPYNGGDFAKYLQSGQAYYFSVTALYKDCRVAGNSVRVVYP